MRRKSIAFRLIASSAVWSILILAIAGYLFSSLFRAAVERTFDERLLLTLDGLLANIEYDAEGGLVEAAALGDGRYMFPFQGWYWQVSPLDAGGTNELRSDSLLEKRLEIPADALKARGESGIARFYIVGPDGHRLRVIEQRYRIEGSAQELSFVVTGNGNELEAEIASFNQTLLVTLSILAIGLVMAMLLQVIFGVRPLHRLRAELVAIRRGNAEMLDEEYPLELEPVVLELNALLQANKQVVERARTQVGNLAHALKTPLTVLRNEAAADIRSAFSNKVVEQAEIMSDQIALYLDRARRAARASTLGSTADVLPVIEGLVRTLKRLYAHREVVASIDCAPTARFRGERQDLEEMIGNLLDNAFKWADRQVRITVSSKPAKSGRGDGRLVLVVEDDGPGLPGELRDEALMRGGRLDETKPGSGLGLSIVAETVAMYEGGIDLGEAAGGGLRVELDLPGVVATGDTRR